jgi:hypothetical protein
MAKVCGRLAKESVGSNPANVMDAEMVTPRLLRSSVLSRKSFTSEMHNEELQDPCPYETLAG